MSFNKGDKVKLINVNDISVWGGNFTAGKVYEVVRGNTGGLATVRINDDKGEEFGLYTHRFELAVDKPILPTLKPGMRVVFEDSKVAGGVIVRNGRDELAVALEGGGWTAVHYDDQRRFYKGYNIVEVYEAPEFWRASDNTARGALVWQSKDAAKIAAADAAVAEAEAELQAAKAARAAL